MTRHDDAHMICALLSLIMIAAVPALSETPEAVSPGEIDRIVEVEGRCPTFTWSELPGAVAYELVVYRLPEDPAAADAAEIELSASDLVLHARVPGGATAWQPSLADGLEPGARHVWFVRATLREEEGEVIESTDWSRSRFFAVSAAPSQREIEHALEVLRQASDLFDAGSETLRTQTSDSRVPMVTPSPGRSSGATPESPKSVPTATAAIKGLIPDSVGETYGVVGVSNSEDGAGVGAANTSGGADLVLDGSADLLADTELRESGIDRPWGTPQTFDITNSAGAGMTLRVDGVEVTTIESDLDADRLVTGTVPDGRLTGTYSQALSLTNPANQLFGNGAGVSGVDADTLDGTDGAAFATDAEAAALVAVHAASADHDGRYYTETELSSPGTSGAVHWDNLGGVPSGFADGIDDNTEYSVGEGLILESGEIRIDWSLFQTSVSPLDAAGYVGEYSSIAIGADGFGLISYRDGSNHDLRAAHCNDTLCSSATTATLDGPGDVGSFTSVSIGTDGLGLISYYDEANANLKVAHCNDTLCSSATTATIDNVGDVGWDTSITIGADGLGLVSYGRHVSFDNFDLVVAHCNDIACSSATVTTLDSTDDVGRYNSIAIGADGFGLISYFDETNLDLKVAHCNDILCSSATTATLDTTGNVGRNTSVAIGADGLGIIAYFDITNSDLKVAHCDDTSCSTAIATTVDSAGFVGYEPSLRIGADGLGIISYHEGGANDDLKVAHCGNITCSNSTSATLDIPGIVGRYTSIAIGADGLGLISYFDVTNGDLKVAHLGIGVP